MDDRDPIADTEPAASAAESLRSLPQRLSTLAASERELVLRLFRIEFGSGALMVPPALSAEVERWFGSVAAVSSQSIVRAENLVTGESVLVNPLRARRPRTAHGGELEHRIESARAGCDFCEPESRTTSDLWGRVRGAHAITAANVAKYDGEHGLVVFREHHPHRFEAAQIHDYLATARAWIEATRTVDASLRFPLLVWNCLDAAGASQVHGHCHVLLARGRPYARDAAWLRAAREYRLRERRDSYWRDFVNAHRALDLVVDYGCVAVVATLTPTKDRELVLVGARDWHGDLGSALARALRLLIDDFGVECFNAALRLPELDASAAPDDLAIARVVDRGSGTRGGGGIGAMELYGTPVVSSDPYDVIAAWRRHGTT